MTRITTVLLASVALAAFGGCGDDENTDTQGGATATEEAATGTTATTETEASGAAGGDALEIEIENFAYSPADATAKVGQTVTWKQRDTAQHDVDSQSGPRIKSPLLDKGEEFEFTAKEAGKVEYICSIHPQMKATLTITD